MEQERQCCSKGLNTRIAYRSYGERIVGLQDEEEDRPMSFMGGRSTLGLEHISGRSRDDLRRLQLIHLIDTALDLIDSDQGEEDDSYLMGHHDAARTCSWTSTSSSSCQQPCIVTPRPLTFPDLLGQEEQSSSTSIDDIKVVLVDLGGNDHQVLAQEPPRIMIMRCPTSETTTIPKDIITAPIPPTTTIIEDVGTS